MSSLHAFDCWQMARMDVLYIFQYWGRDATDLVCQIILSISDGDVPYDPLRRVVVDNYSIAPRN